MITINDKGRSDGLPANARVRITTDSDSKQVLKKFCMNNMVPVEYTEHEFKERLHKVDMRDYGLRLRYAKESKITDETTKSKLNNLVGSRTAQKLYRYTQRYSVLVAETKDKTTKLKVDFSCVKQGTGYSFSGAQILGMCADRVKDQYEVEIEISNQTGVTLEHINELEEQIKDTVNFLVSYVQGGLAKYIVSNAVSITQY